MRYPWNLKYWDSGEWQVCKERLQDMEKRHERYCPGSIKRITQPLSSLAPDQVRVMVVGQDPYPDPRFATGTAFSIPENFGPAEFPVTLRSIFAEYSKDLHYPSPTTGNLQRWTDQGVLLWNAIPTTKAGQSLSHDWEEYSYLTREIVQRLAERGIVFCLLGSVARRYFESISLDNNSVVVTSHPSPRGSLSSKAPFKGSRIFTTINDKLNDIGLKPIDWRLP